jgi:regulator of sigma E protease
LDRHENSPSKPEVRPSEGQTEPDAPAPEPTMGEWLRANGPTLLILGALFVFLYIKFDSEGLWAIAKAAIGLGLVIFVHELGHFLVAKWCDVHVTVFSIGFGPAIPGCSFKWGETTYKLALFPLGGYVQMVGQVDGDESTDEEGVNDPRSYRNKSVGQRMAIISAGVIMNVILAVICFIVVFQGPGKDRKAGVVGATDPGSPAWTEAIPAETQLREIGGIENPYFEDLKIVVMGTGSGERLKIAYRDPRTGKPAVVEVEPRKLPTDPTPVLGIMPAFSTQLELQRFAGRGLSRPVMFQSAAAQASPPLAFGDRIVGTTDPERPSETAPLPADRRLRDPADKSPRKPGEPADFAEFARRMRLLAGQGVKLQVERTDADGKRELKDIWVPAASHVTLGARMEMGPITAVRKGSPGDQPPGDKSNGIQLPATRDANGQSYSFQGDVIEMVEVERPGGRLLRFTNIPAKDLDPAAKVVDPAAAAPVLLGAASLPPLAAAGALAQTFVDTRPLDPARLPDQLREWAREMARAGLQDQREVRLHVRRHNQQDVKQFTKRTLRLRWQGDWEDNHELPMSLSSPLSIPGLGLAYQIKTTVAATEGSGDPSRSLQAGDLIKKYRFSAIVNDKGETEKGSWVELKPEQWARVFMLMQQLPNITEMYLQVERGGKTVELTLKPTPVADWPLAERGLLLEYDTRVQKADSFLGAIGLGLRDTRNSMIQVFQNLRGMIVGRISVENLGGPITIGRVAYYFAGLDFWEFVFFLGLISINLAVINFLPIPVLDGGHMVFLLYEKIRGKPASEGVRVGATYAGLLLLASLMIFVLFLDIKRLL